MPLRTFGVDNEQHGHAFLVVSHWALRKSDHVQIVPWKLEAPLTEGPAQSRP